MQLRAVTGSTTVSEDLTWDTAGRLAARSVSVDATGGPSASYTTEFGYDLQGRLTAVTYPSLPGIDVASVGYTYDGRDNVVAVTDDQGQPFVRVHVQRHRRAGDRDVRGRSDRRDVPVRLSRS